MYQKTITLFNYYESKISGIFLWYPTVLRNVNIVVDKAAITAKYGEKAQDNAILHVRQPNGSKPWLSPKEWANQVNDSLADFVTFKSGDFFWLGEWPDEIPVNEEDYVDGFYDYMSNKYDYVFRVTTVGGPYSLIPHFEILGR